MSNNFDVYAWKRNQLIETTLDDADLKAKKRVDYMVDSILKSFPELDQPKLKYAVSSGFTDLVFDGLLESNSNENEYEVEYWTYKNDDYDTSYITIKASNKEEAIQKAKKSTRRGKDFKVIQINGKPLNESVEDPIKETIKFALENIEGYSKYFPGGKTKGLDNDTLSTILMQIVKDTEEEGKQLDESTLCKRGRNYLAARKRAGEKPSAYLSGRAVKVCKGQIKGSDGKKKKSY